MNLFIDTSALVKLFHEEEGSGKVTQLIAAGENQIWVSELVRIEFRSALCRRFRNREIDDSSLEKAIEGFEQQLALFNIEPVGHANIREAEALLKQYGKVWGLRTLDALHLGAFSLISDKDWLFVAADEKLCEVSRHIGYNSLNPLSIE